MQYSEAHYQLTQVEFENVLEFMRDVWTHKKGQANPSARIAASLWYVRDESRTKVV